jgi:murein DD-endopeptidase MepM/ murein hydrolase activator NlpD
VVRRLSVVLCLFLLLAAPAAADDPAARKAAIDSRLAGLQTKIANAREREQALTAQIARVSSEIQELEGQVGDVMSDLAVLEHDLALQREKLARLTELFRLQTAKLNFLRGQHEAAVDRLNDRIVAAYQAGDVTSLDVILSAESYSDLVAKLEYVKQIAAQDKRIADEVGRAKVEVRDARARTRKTRVRVAAVTRAIAYRTAQQRELRNRLVANEQALSSARSAKQQSLTAVRQSKEEYLHEAEGLAAQSAQLAARIQSSSGSFSPAVPVSSSGLIWPVSGPVVSGFGMRWGRMHEGIDIAAASGTAIQASASGRVIYSGWMGGYGNLVVIDHGGGLSTAYAHQSSIGASNGQGVSQGQVIGYVGCTGHCFGSHLHFEVRVNGSPVDPLGYL